MRYTTPFVFLAATALAQDVSDEAYDYFDKVCLPKNATGYPDFNAPCNAIQAIQAQCAYGPDYLTKVLAALGSGSGSSDDLGFDEPDSPPMQSNATQRICICESQFFDQAAGCGACGSKHGNAVPDAGIDADTLATLSSSYCAASNTPTAAFADVLFDYGNSVFAAQPTTTSASSVFSDPLGNMTQVSLYYTPKVTGTAAWIVAQETGTGTESGMITAVNTQNGQIKPTASVSGSGGAAANTTTSGNAAMRTEAVAAAGLIGFAGLVAFL